MNVHDTLLAQILRELPEDWPVSHTAARSTLERWLGRALRRCDDLEWARGFARHCPSRPPQEYLHRLLPGTPTLLCGVRFKGGDVSLPFVDLLAWDEGLQGHWDSVHSRIAQAYAPFGPHSIRLRWPGAEPPLTGLAVDQVLVAERLDRLRLRTRPELPGLVLQRAEDLDFHGDFLDAFNRWRAAAGPLGPEVHPASPEDLQPCVDAGAVICASDGRWRGLMAATRREERALGGFCVVELFLDPQVHGRGWAPALQGALIDALPGGPGDALYGTIHRLNAPSLRTALRCGRRVIETWWFWPVNRS